MVIAPQEKDTAHSTPLPDAAFLAQLLATRETRTDHRLRHSATASLAYAATSTITVRRLPAGYRRTLDA